MQVVVQEYELKPIDFNFEELKRQLAENLEKYQNLIVVEDDLPKYKQDRANLNKLDKALDEERKRIERKHNEPFKDFKNKIEILRGMVKEPIKALDDQLVKFEINRKERKKRQIEGKFHELNDIPEIKLSSIWHESWLNATVTIKSISDTISEYIGKVKADINAISELKSEHEKELQELYLKTFSLSTVLNRKAEIDKIIAQAEAKRKAEEAAAAEKKRKEAEEKAKAEQAERERIQREKDEKIKALQAEIKIKEKALENATIEVQSFNSVEDHLNDKPEKTEYIKTEGSEVEPEFHEIIFKVTATKTQLDDLKKFMVSRNIKFGRV